MERERERKGKKDGDRERGRQRGRERATQTDNGLRRCILAGFHHRKIKMKTEERGGKKTVRGWDRERQRERERERETCVGTKRRFNPLLNHQGCASPKSVTTVTKGILRPSFK